MTDINLTTDFDSVMQGKYWIRNNCGFVPNAQGLPYSQLTKVIDPLVDNKVSIVIDWNWPNGNGNVKSYPDILYGDAPWQRGYTHSTVPNMPVLLTQMGRYIANVDVNVQAAAEARYNVAFDIWIGNVNPLPQGTGGRTHEIMIWINYKNYYPLGVPGLGIVSIDEQDYAVYQYGNATGSFWFIKVVSMTKGTINISSFLLWLIAHGHITSEEFLTDIEFGTEITKGIGVTTINSYFIDYKENDMLTQLQTLLAEITAQLATLQEQASIYQQLQAKCQEMIDLLK